MERSEVLFYHLIHTHTPFHIILVSEHT